MIKDELQVGYWGGYISDIDKDRDLHGVSRGRNITNSYTSMRIFRTTGGKLTNK